MRIVILGAGFGGLELTTRLSDEFGDDVDVVLIDQGESFVFGFSKLDVMFGRTPATAVRHHYTDIVKPGVRFIQATVQSIDPAAKRVETDAGSFDADILVVALGADPHPSATPGLIEGGHEFYTVAGAFALRGVLDTFEGGRVIVGVTSTPFKCPPAPSETALLMHDFLTERGLRGTTDAGTYDGRGMCYLEFGRDQIAKVDVTFLAGQSPSGMLEGPSETLVADKAEFGTSRIRRWFGQPCPATADA